MLHAPRKLFRERSDQQNFAYLAFAKSKFRTSRKTLIFQKEKVRYSKWKIWFSKEPKSQNFLVRFASQKNFVVLRPNVMWTQDPPPPAQWAESMFLRTFGVMRALAVNDHYIGVRSTQNRPILVYVTVWVCFNSFLAILVFLDFYASVHTLSKVSK